jgi:hypothetical protein
MLWIDNQPMLPNTSKVIRKPTVVFTLKTKLELRFEFFMGVAFAAPILQRGHPEQAQMFKPRVTLTSDRVNQVHVETSRRRLSRKRRSLSLVTSDNACE